MSPGLEDRVWLETLDRACEFAIDRLRTADEPVDVNEFAALKRLRVSVRERIAASGCDGNGGRRTWDPCL
jgi:hypothetical protein